MIDLPMNAEVYGTDEIAGIATYVIANPLNHQVTHLVVKASRPPFKEHLVPLQAVAHTAPKRIHLRCTREAVEEMDPFSVEEYVPTQYPNYLFLPYVVPAQAVQETVPTHVLVKHHNLRPGEMAVWRGAQVYATDGYVGLVDELLISSTHLQVTHLVLRQRHIFAEREISIPVSQIERVSGDTIYIKLDRHSIQELPTTPIQRWELQDKK